MPDPNAIRTTVERYMTRYSAADREGWLDLFAVGATLEDPVGTPIRTGREEIGAFYDQGWSVAEQIEIRPIGRTIVLANEAAFAEEVRPTIRGATMSLPAIVVMTFDDDGRITSQRGFADFAMVGPAED